MNRRIATRVVDTGGEIKNTLIDKDASEVWWITISVQQLGAQGCIKIYDGFDTGGKLVWQHEPGYSRPHNFIPPIQCETGVFVYSDLGIASFTIAWRPKKWDRPTTKPRDVITPPKEE